MSLGPTLVPGRVLDERSVSAHVFFAKKPTALSVCVLAAVYLRTRLILRKTCSSHEFFFCKEEHLLLTSTTTQNENIYITTATTY